MVLDRDYPHRCGPSGLACAPTQTIPAAHPIPETITMH